MERTEFEYLFLHAGLLPQLALAQMTAEFLAAPPPALSEADAKALADESARNEAGWLAAHPEGAPGQDTDWFGAGGVSDEERARLLADAERELAEFEGGQGVAAADPLPMAMPPAGAAPLEPATLDLERELADAYADRPAIAGRAARAYAKADLPALEAALAPLSAGRAPLTGSLTVNEAEPWIALARADDPALLMLVHQLQRLDDA